MYILFLLFGLSNFYFLLSTLTTILIFLIEYILVPLANIGTKMLNLPLVYQLEKTIETNESNKTNNKVVDLDQNYNKKILIQPIEIKGTPDNVNNQQNLNTTKPNEIIIDETLD